MNVFLIVNYIVYVLYVVVYLGIWSGAPKYLEYLRTLLKLYVGCMLVYLFNPLFTVTSSVVSRDVAFSAGIFVLTGLSLDKIMDSRNILRPVLPGLVL
jgi:hypothetical protein